LHFGDRQTDRLTYKQTNEQMDSIDALSHSRCRELRLNNRSIMRFLQTSSAAQETNFNTRGRRDS